jgi:hypothetical protein
MIVLCTRAPWESAKTIVQGGGRRFPRWSVPEVLCHFRLLRVAMRSILGAIVHRVRLKGRWPCLLRLHIGADDAGDRSAVGNHSP